MIEHGTLCAYLEFTLQQIHNIHSNKSTIHTATNKADTHLPQLYFMVATMSSIFSIMWTYSVAWWMALVLTSSGWMTPCCNMSLMQPFFTSIPAYFSPAVWRCRSSVTMPMGWRPAFSASV